MSLLTIVQAACQEVGIPLPGAVAGSTDTQIQQLMALANRAGNVLATHPVKDSCWSALQKQYLFNTSFLTTTGSTVSGSNVITVASTAGIAVGYGVSGANLPNACTVVSINAGANTVTLDATQLAKATASGNTYTFSQIAYPLPSDYDRSILQTQWDRTYRWQMLGPLTPQEWQVLKSGIAPTGPRIRYRIEGNYFYIDPYPASVDTLGFEYISNGWAQSAAGAAQTRFLADTDTSVLNEDLLTLSLIWRWKAAKGLAYQEEYNQYEVERDQRAARDAGGARTLLTNRQAFNSPLLTSAQIPDSGYGIPST